MKLQSLSSCGILRLVSTVVGLHIVRSTMTAKQQMEETSANDV